MNTRYLSIYEVGGAFAIPVLEFPTGLFLLYLASTKRRDIDLPQTREKTVRNIHELFQNY